LTSDPLPIAGAAAIVCYGVHAAFHLSRGEPQDLLWACHIAALLVGVGLLIRSADLNAIGLLWSSFGTPLWILDLATGGEWIPTALLTHGAALAFGVYGIRRLGLPRAAAVKATAAFVPLWAITRAVTPPWANVNVAFSVYQGWEHTFTSYPPYFAMLLGLAFATFMIVERALAFAIARPTDRAYRRSLTNSPVEAELARHNIRP
jgi:hypothetical protein